MVGGSAETGEGRIEVGDFVVEGREVGVDAVVEVTDVVAPSEFELKARVLYITCIHRRSSSSDNQGRSRA